MSQCALIRSWRSMSLLMAASMFVLPPQQQIHAAQRPFNPDVQSRFLQKQHEAADS